MSGSHFGSGYFPDDYFGLYFQPDSGGVIIGSLAGSFSGSATFTGTASNAGLPWWFDYEYRGGGIEEEKKRKRVEVVEEQTEPEIVARVAPETKQPELLVFKPIVSYPPAAPFISNERLVTEWASKVDSKAAEFVAAEDYDDEELLLLWAA